MKKKKRWFVVLLLLLLIGGFVGVNWNNWFKSMPTNDIEGAEDWTGNKETYTGEKNTNTIDIPGFDQMNLKADATVQKVNLYNPEANTCYFKMSLYLFDGTKLWESKLVPPSKAIYEIKINKTLKEGKYKDAKLKYECFAMNEERTPLNGSEIKLTLNVMK